MSESNCLACSGAWCLSGAETTSVTTDTPTTTSPTTGPPTTTSPTTGPPTTTTDEPIPEYEYESMNLGTKTCKNNQRIARLCLGQNSCSMSDCQTYCNENAECMFYF